MAADATRDSAADILTLYFEKVGGREKIFQQSEAAAKGKKRGRPQSATPTAAKRSRKNGVHPADSALSATAKKWSPPAGLWEDDIEAIDACEDEGNGKLLVYLVWKNGQKTKHPTNVIYKKCPQKVSISGRLDGDAGHIEEADAFWHRCCSSTNDTSRSYEMRTKA